MYADAMAPFTKPLTLSQLETALNQKIQVAERYLFYTRQTSQKLNLTFFDKPLKQEKYPTYMGMKFDRTLTFKYHIIQLIGTL